MADIFLSYNKRDRELAARVVVLLRARGFTVWWDEDLTPRESWDRITEREIAAATHVLVLWTHNSTASDWVRIEANYARNCQPSKLVQARFDGSEVPMAFSMVQYADLNWDRPERSPSWPRLISWLTIEHDETQLPAPPQPDPRPSPPSATIDSGDLTYAQVFKRLLAGAALYAVFLMAIMLMLPQNMSLLPLFGASSLLIPVFGSVYVFSNWSKPRRWTKLVYFLVFVYLAYGAAYYLALWHGSGTQGKQMYLSGAIGGVVGSSLSFLALLALPIVQRTPRTLIIMAAGIMALTVVGAIGTGGGYDLVTLFFGGRNDQVAAFLYLCVHLPWQAAFAFFLARLFTPKPT